ncbi:MAG: hypothetical protein WCR20_03735, partial [Verrucomicrobiota bacterium]
CEDGEHLARMGSILRGWGASCEDGGMQGGWVVCVLASQPDPLSHRANGARYESTGQRDGFQP